MTRAAPGATALDCVTALNLAILVNTILLHAAVVFEYHFKRGMGV